jgi:hypothetical protein
MDFHGLLRRNGILTGDHFDERMSFLFVDDACLDLTKAIKDASKVLLASSDADVSTGVCVATGCVFDLRDSTNKKSST